MTTIKYTKGKVCNYDCGNSDVQKERLIKQLEKDGWIVETIIETGYKTK